VIVKVVLSVPVVHGVESSAEYVIVNVPVPTVGLNILLSTPSPLNVPPTVASGSLFIKDVRSNESSFEHIFSMSSKVPAFAGASSITRIVRSTESSQSSPPIV